MALGFSLSSWKLLLRSPHKDRPVFQVQLSVVLPNSVYIYIIDPTESSVLFIMITQERRFKKEELICQALRNIKKDLQTVKTKSSGCIGPTHTVKGS